MVQVADEQAKVSLSNATAKVGYKARPLNGIGRPRPISTTGLFPPWRNS